MIIETKYNIGDVVWFIMSFKDFSWRTRVIGILIEEDRIAYKVHYGYFDYFISEEKLFPSEMQLLESLRHTNQNTEL